MLNPDGPCPATTGLPLSRDDREWLLEVIAEIGLPEAARRLQLARGTVAAAAAGAGCYRRTHALVRLSRVAS